MFICTDVHKYETGNIDRNSSIPNVHFGGGVSEKSTRNSRGKKFTFLESQFFLSLYFVHFSPLSVIYGIGVTCSVSSNCHFHATTNINDRGNVRASCY